MKLIKWKIELLKKELEELEKEERDSMDSVKEEWNSSYVSFQDKCHLMYCLAFGIKYSLYGRTGDKLKIREANDWDTKQSLDYCTIYEDFENIGFISPKNGLFNATKEYHKTMWVNAIKEDKEVDSFKSFQSRLKKDMNFLISHFNKSVREKGSGVFHTYPYLMEFENKKLKTGKYYIYTKDNSRRIS